MDSLSPVVREDTIEHGFFGTLQKLKYEYRPDITNRAVLEANFREKFEALNRVPLSDSKTLRSISGYMVLIAREQKLMIMRALSSLCREAHGHLHPSGLR